MGSYNQHNHIYSENIKFNRDNMNKNMFEKRFIISRVGNEGFVSHILDVEERKLLSIGDVIDCLNCLDDENNKLWNELRNQCEVEICEICHYSHYYETLDSSTMKQEYGMSCLKGHKSNGGAYEYEEVMKCKDFKLMNIGGL